MAPRSQLWPFRRPEIKLYPAEHETGYICTLPEVVEFNARENPDHIFCLQARKSSESSTSTLIPVTNIQLRDAIAQCAIWLKRNLPLGLPTVSEDGSVKKGAPVALLLESDVGLWIHEMALLGMGVPVLLISARLSATAVHSLLERTSACAILVSRRLEATAREAAQGVAKGIPVHSPVPFEALLSKDPQTYTTICHPNHYISESDRDVVILHSSGTTGLPKPIYVSHRHLLSYVNNHCLHDEAQAQAINLSTLPLYHGFGYVAPALAMGVGKTVCFPPGSVVPSATSTLALLSASRASSLMTVPSILDDLSRLGKDAMNRLADLDFVTFGGGLLNPAVGTALSSHGVRLLNHYGTTETGPLAPIFVPDARYNWRFFRLRTDMRLQLDEIAPPPQSPASGGGAARRFKLTTFPFGLGRPFEIQDQLVCSPEHPGTDFNAVGRTDDTVVLATGEKVQPQLLEAALCASPLVRAAVVFGEQRFEIGVLVQPAREVEGEGYEALRRELWPIIEGVRAQMDEHARIQSPEAILIVPCAVALARTDKGSLARKDVYAMFEAEIARVYQTLESAGPVQLLRWESLEEDLKRLISGYVKWKEDWESGADLFERGMNSLQAIRVRRALVVAVARSFDSVIRSECIDREFVYSHPSVRSMAEFFCEATKQTTGAPEQDANPEVDAFVQRYVLAKPTSSTSTSSGQAVVLLTGATGSLGSHCLVSLLLSSPRVEKVICLVRPDDSTDALSRLQKSLEEKHLRLSDAQLSRVEVVECTTASDLLGLSSLHYTTLIASITHILHIAWPMDFHWKLPSFQSQFQTLHNLLALSREIRRTRHIKPRLTFISSIATVGQYARVHGGRIIPESPVGSVDCLNPIGYAEAKLVCERILEHTRQNYPDELEVSYIRVGQVAGSSKTGYWNVNEHFPSLTLSWLPVNLAATAISEILLSPTALDEIHHLENPVRQSWHDLLQILSAELGISQLLPMDEWLERVRSTPIEKNPAKKLYDFFAYDFVRMACGEVIMGTENARRVSETLRGVDAVGAETVREYVRYWRGVERSIAESVLRLDETQKNVAG
ncbi:hypothetical protein BJX64DRAFT_288581 [Aspergillus heterothallicus]